MSPQRNTVWAALLCAACTAPIGANPATRCEQAVDCADGLSCHRGFCVHPDTVESDDAWSAPTDGDASVGAPSDNGVDANDGGSTSNQGNNNDAGGRDEGDNGGEPPDDTADGRGDATECAGPACCLVSEVLCGLFCNDLRAETERCAMCRDACERGNECLSGRCCEPDESLCGGRCVDTLSDDENCGTCGHECSEGHCEDGTCRRDP